MDMHLCMDMERKRIRMGRSTMNNYGDGKGTASGNRLERGFGTGGASGWGWGDGWGWAYRNSSGRGRKPGSGNDLWTNRDGFGCGIASGRAIRLTQVGLPQNSCEWKWESIGMDIYSCWMGDVLENLLIPQLREERMNRLQRWVPPNNQLFLLL